ncbi:MAG: four-carbon acid sugar kinase family protein [Acetobacteraceae bacterium]|nr:four-carbon acid sugar kinase family protein [Acetobacteraceae bacterium]
MTTLRLLADDLTGALDTAAEFVPLVGPVDAFWPGSIPASWPPCAAIDTGTREQDEAAATAGVTAATAGMRGAAIAFKKLDSLMRGQTLPELAACLRAGSWRAAVLAPAFPFQGRITRGAQQWASGSGGWQPVGPELTSALAGLGLSARRGRLGERLAAEVTVFDAENDGDLVALVESLRGMDDILWCGTGGLAQALASGRPAPAPPIASPILGLFGSDQAATAAQLAACAPHWLALPESGPAAAQRLGAALDRDGVVMASLELPPGLDRADAARRIGAALATLTDQLPPPGTLVVAGGETLRGLCVALGAQSLAVRGRLIPGVPVSTLRGGRWHAVTIVSKSGAFGPPTLWRDLLPFPALPTLERISR